MSIETLTVDLPDRAYDIAIGPGLLAEAGVRIMPFLKRPKVVIITDETVADLHMKTLQSGLSNAGISSNFIAMAAGEKTKSWNGLEVVVEWLIEQKVERDDIVIAFGGGVIGDLAGFAAAILRRGVNFVQIPTSLLAQVDSSVGGKTGINSPLGKNLIGAFHQPQLVLADTDVLDTLSPREFTSGYGEVVKYGLLGDAKFFEWLEKNGPSLAFGDQANRIAAIKRSCEMKAEIVARDEKERGDRALLNLGHTFGHALEAATGYSDRLLHGEGVAIGCALAFELSQKMGVCSQEIPSRVRQHLAVMGMKKDLSDIAGDLPDADGLIALMGQDKKVTDGKIAFILARSIGDAFVEKNVDMDVVKTVLNEALAAR
ncbi:MAG: 3-dehydroquinate synthase [Rhodobacteraceae bacterium]|nr:MAG: 3-dehydroquinate synthase [Paracoccaceae bacterium]